MRSRHLNCHKYTNKITIKVRVNNEGIRYHVSTSKVAMKVQSGKKEKTEMTRMCDREGVMEIHLTFNQR